MPLTIKSIVELQSFRDWNDATGAYSVFIDQLDPTKGWYFNYFNPGFAKVDLTTGLDIFSGSFWGTDPTSFVDAPDEHEDGTILWSQDDQNHYYILNSSRVSDATKTTLWKIHEGSSSPTSFGNNHFVVDASLDFKFPGDAAQYRITQVQGSVQAIRPASDGNRYYAGEGKGPFGWVIDTAGSMSFKGHWWMTEETDTTNLTFGGSAAASLNLVEGASNYTLTAQRVGTIGNSITVAVDNTTAGAPTVVGNAITLHTQGSTVAAYATAHPIIFTTNSPVKVTTSGPGTNTFTTTGATGFTGGTDGITHIKIVAGAGLFGEDQMTVTTNVPTGAQTEDYFRMWGMSDPALNGMFLRPDSNAVGNVFTASGFFSPFNGPRVTSYDADVTGTLYAGQGYNFFADTAPFMDKNGDIWWAFNNQGIGVHGADDSFGVGVFLVKWHPQNGTITPTGNVGSSPLSSGPWLNVDVRFVPRSVLGTDRFGISFDGYIPSTHSVILGNSISSSGQLIVVSLTDFTQTAFNDDTGAGDHDGSNFFNGTFDSPIAAFERGEQPDNTIGVQGDLAPGGVGDNGQYGGIFNVFNPSLVLQNTLNITTAIASAGVPDPPTQQPNNGRRRGFNSYSPWSSLAYKAVGSDGYLLVAYEFIGSPAFLITFSGFTPATLGGYLLTSEVDAKSALQNLMAAFFLDCVESDFKLHFIPRGVNSSVITIPENDIGLKSDSAKLIETQTMTQELPKEAEVLFIDPNIDWQQNKQHKARSSRVVKTKQKVALSLPLVMTVAEARQIAEKALYLAWVERKPWNFNLFRPLYMTLDPTDVISFEYQNSTYIMRVVGNTIGVQYTGQLNGVSEDTNAYISTVVGGDAGGIAPNPVAPTIPSVTFLYDVPYLTDSDAVADRSHTGYYWASSANDFHWVGDVLYRSSDNTNFDSVGSTTARMWYGTVVGTLGDPPSLWTWDDTNVLHVIMADPANFTLSGTTDLNVLNGANVLIVGSGEVIQYVNAVQTSPGHYTLSRLLRGRRNTEFLAYGHSPSEFVVDPTTGINRETDPLTLIGLLRYYRGVTVGQDITAVTSTNFTENANDLKPASPVNITGVRDMSNNLTIGWTRRTRYAGDWLNNTGNVPLNEDSEQYDIDVLVGIPAYHLFTSDSVGGAAFGTVTNPGNILLPIPQTPPCVLHANGSSGDIASVSFRGMGCNGLFKIYVDYEVTQNDLVDPGQTLPAWEIQLRVPEGNPLVTLASAAPGAGTVGRNTVSYSAPLFSPTMDVLVNTVAQFAGGTGGVNVVIHAVYATGHITGSPLNPPVETVVRTIHWTPGTYDANGNPKATYSAADQTTDFGSPQSAVSVSVYQISAQVGRGQEGDATV